MSILYFTTLIFPFFISSDSEKASESFYIMLGWDCKTEIWKVFLSLHMGIDY